MATQIQNLQNIVFYISKPPKKSYFWMLFYSLRYYANLVFIYTVGLLELTLPRINLEISKKSFAATECWLFNGATHLSEAR